VSHLGLTQRAGATYRELKGAWYRRALLLLEMAERSGGPDTEGFRDFLAHHSGDNWHVPDEIIMRSLSEVPDDENT
jgi:hypothetical protein